MPSERIRHITRSCGERLPFQQRYIPIGSVPKKVDGSTAEYGADPALDEWAKGYLMLEYNNIGAHAKRDQSIFNPAE